MGRELEDIVTEAIDRLAWIFRILVWRPQVEVSPIKDVAMDYCRMLGDSRNG